MKTVEQVDPEIIEHYEDNLIAAQALEQKQIYDKLAAMDNNPYRMTDNEHDVAVAIENAARTLLAVSEQIESSDVIDLYSKDATPEDKDKFATSYAMYAGCMNGLWRMDEARRQHSAETNIGPMIQLEQDDLEGDQYKHMQDRTSRVFQTFLQEYSGLLDNVENQDALPAQTADYLSAVAADCYTIMERYQDYLDVIEEINLEVDGFTLNGLDGQGTAHGIATKQVDWDEIVGNNEFEEEIRTSLWTVMDYDKDRGNQVADVLGSTQDFIIGYSDPGTGKSLSMAAAATEMRDMAEELGKEVVIEEIGDVKDKYHGGTAENIREKFDRVTDPNSIGLLLADDIDGLFPSREEMEGEVEDKDAFQELLQQIQGFMSSEDRNNYLILGATNKPTQLDDALRSRSKMVKAPGPQTEEQYEDIFEIHLNSVSEELVQVDHYDQIAEKAHEHKDVVTGRAVEKITNGLAARSAMKDVIADVGMDLFDMSWQEKRELLMSYADPITEDRVLQEIEDYVEEEEEQEERARKKEQERRVERLEKQVESRKAFKEENPDEYEEFIENW